MKKEYGYCVQSCAKAGVVVSAKAATSAICRLLIKRELIFLSERLKGVRSIDVSARVLNV